MRAQLIPARAGRAAVVLLAAGLTLSACGAGTVEPRGQSDPAPGAAATEDAEPAASNAPAETADAEPTQPEPTEEPTPEPGSRENPFAIDNPVGNDDWDIQLGEPYEAWEEVQAENMFNDPPADGMEFWMLPVTVTYIGTETADPAWDLEFGFVGDDGRTYDDDCGVIPDEMYDVGEMYPDAEASANVCLAVPEGAPGLWTVAASFTEPVFFTTEGR